MRKRLLHITIFISFCFYGMSFQSVENPLQLAIACYQVDIYSNDWLDGTNISKEQAQNATAIKVIGNNYFNRIPISPHDFPNLESISFEDCCFISNLNGITEFKKLKEITIKLNDEGDECTHEGAERKLLCDISEIWKIETLEKLTLDGVPFHCIDTNLLQLKKLQQLRINSNYIPVDIISRAGFLSEINLSWTHDGNKDSIDLYILKQLYENINQKPIPYIYCEHLILAELQQNDTNKYQKNYSGDYSLSYPNGLIAVNGFFTSGVRDSIWTYFDRKGNFLDSIYYSSGKLKKHVSMRPNGLGDFTINTNWYSISDSILINQKNWRYISNNKIVYKTKYIVLKGSDNISCLASEGMNMITIMNLNDGYKYKLLCNKPELKDTSKLYISSAIFTYDRGVGSCLTNKDVKDSCICSKLNKKSFEQKYKELIFLHKNSFDSLYMQFIPYFIKKN